MSRTTCGMSSVGIRRPFDGSTSRSSSCFYPLVHVTAGSPAGSAPGSIMVASDILPEYYLNLHSALSIKCSRLVNGAD